MATRMLHNKNEAPHRHEVPRRAVAERRSHCDLPDTTSLYPCQALFYHSVPCVGRCGPKRGPCTFVAKPPVFA
jgi:hypothetical protein